MTINLNVFKFSGADLARAVEIFLICGEDVLVFGFGHRSVGNSNLEFASATSVHFIMPSTLLNVLESIAHLLWVEPRETLSEGKLFLRFLGLDKQCQSADESWRLIRERIETVFGPKLLTWCQVRVLQMYYEL